MSSPLHLDVFVVPYKPIVGKVIRVLRRAVERGVTFIDAART